MKESEKTGELIRENAEQILAVIKDSFSVLDADFRYLYVNDASLAMSGLRREDFIGKTVWEVFPDVIETVLEKAFRQAMREREFVRIEYLYLTANRWFDYRIHPTDKGLTIFISEITERRRAEEKLRVSEERYRAVVESQTELICRFRLDGTILFANEAYAKSVGSTAEQLINGNFWNFIPETEHVNVREMINRLTPDTPEVQIENRFETTKGVRWTLWTNRALRFDSEGRTEEAQSTGIDITDRKHSEEVLRERNAQLDLLAQIGQKLIIGKGQNETATLEAIFGQVCETLGAEICFNYLLGDQPETLRLNATIGVSAADREFFKVIRFGEFLCGKVAKRRKPLIIENMPERKSSESAAPYFADVRCYAGFPLVAGENLLGTLAFATKRRNFFRESELSLMQAVVDRVAASVERSRLFSDLRESERRFRNMADHAPVMIWITEKDGTCTYLSQSWYEFTGQTPETGLGLGWLDATHPDDAPEAEKIFLAANERRGAFRLEYRLRRKDGEYRWAIDSAQPRFSETGEFLGHIGSVLDISQRKWQEELLQRNHETFFNLVQNAPFGIYIVDSDFRLIQISAGSQEVFRGIDPLIGRDFTEILQTVWEEPFATEATEHFRHTLATGEPYRAYDTTEQRGNIGDVESYDWKIERISLPDGAFGVVCYFYDLTVQKRIEQALRESEERMRLAMNASSILTWEIDLETNQTKVSDNFSDVFGFSDALRPAELNDSVSTLIHADDAPAFIAGVARTVSGQGDFRLECRLIHPETKEIIWIEAHCTLIQATGEEGLRVVGIVQNINERKKSEDRLRESEEKFRALADNISQLAWMMDADGWIFWYNERWFEYTGTTLEQMQGWGWKAVHMPEEVERVTEKFKKHIALGEIWEDTFPLRAKTGEYRWFLSRAVPIRDENGKIVRWFGTNTDVEELRNTKLQAEQANRLKDEFLATVSHELRTPLNAILGWSTIARKDENTETMLRALEVIERSARNQNQLISDILDVSRIITGKLRLNLQLVRLSEIVRTVIDTVRPSLNAKKIILETSLEPDENVEIEGDADRLQQIVWNLLANAVKFTPENGEIKVALKYTDTSAEIVVADNGEGIEPEFLPFVFDRFRQADGKKNRKHGGLGLGLAIVRHLTEMLGGKATVASQGLGWGASFLIRLPINVRSVQTEGNNHLPMFSSEIISQKKAQPRLLENLKIIVVDDQPDAIELAQFILSSEGAQVLPARSVDEALKVFDSEEEISAIITDIGMPEKDGFVLMNELQNRFKSQNITIPTIALTAYAGETDKNQILKSGFSTHLPKPFEPQVLIETLADLIRDKK